MPTPRATIWEVIEFVEARAKDLNGVNPFAGGRFLFETVAGAVYLLHSKPAFENLRVFDLKETKNMWTYDGDIRHDLARSGTQLIMEEFCRVNRCSIVEALPQITWKTFHYLPVGPWKTTFGGMHQRVYGCSTYAALRDLIKHNDDFKEYSDFMPYDMVKPPRKYWAQEYKKKFSMKLISNLIGQKEGSLEERVLSVSKDDMTYLPVTRYGSTPRLALRTYGSVREAMLAWAKAQEKTELVKIIKKRKDWHMSYSLPKV